tara:strand:+ start:10771 stop:11607 length:837 start_codon:yes stop_codon:yes gene_type:complete
MSYRKRNPYMTINHGLIGAKKGHGDNRFLLTWTFSEYSHVDTQFFAFDSYEELMTSGKYNWFNILWTWQSAVDQQSLINDATGLDPDGRLEMKDWDIAFPETLEIVKDYDRDRREWVLLKNEKAQFNVETFSNNDRKISIPIYNADTVQEALDNDCNTPKMIMDMVNFDFKKWLETPKMPKKMKSIYTITRGNQRHYNMWSLRYLDMNSAYTYLNKTKIEDIKKTAPEWIEEPLYDEREDYEEAYTNIQVCITNNEILLKTGTSYDDTYAYNITIKKL